ncbi:sensor histidine kinase [Bacteriovorax sp. Seq25_V]|uniref:sensor histidine kinase n=1 Tax=Bacteriovorax sp. Seq25_V TaxID=1201288 RepID=UPI00038A28A9|nr:ATP-binding protein [Bacteriovorax sp. Seq25_V]EQC43857.1 GHKL domain protein [Bacteriovorax sp. Seq25_V]
MNKEDYQILDSDHDNINRKAKILSALVFLIMILIFFIIGNLNSYDSKTNIYNNRLYSRVHLQVSNALYDSNFLMEKYLRTNNFAVLEDSLTRLKSALALFRSSADHDFGDIEGNPSLRNIVNSKNTIKEIIDQFEAEVSRVQAGDEVNVVELYNIEYRISTLIKEILTMEATYWRERLVDFHYIQKGQRNNKYFLIGLGILTLTLVITLLILIARRKRLEKTVKDGQLRIINASKMASLGEFSATVAHEINNPLSIILWRLANLEKSIISDGYDEKIIKGIASVREQSRRIDRIIKGIKLLAKNSNDVDNERYDIDDCIFEFKELVEHRLHIEGINLYIDSQVTSRNCLFGKSVQLIQVLTNLLNNSVEAILNDDEKWIKLTIKEDHEVITISFMDSGHASNIKNSDKVFEVFYSSKKDRGTGLGLGISRQIIESFNGTLKFNVNSVNTEFLITLPKFS